MLADRCKVPRSRTLKSGQQNASSVDSKSPMHSFELRTSSTLPRCSRVTSNPEGELQSEAVRIRLGGLEAFMRWVVVTLVENRKIASLTPIKLSKSQRPG